jgi:hypothetical protein
MSRRPVRGEHLATGGRQRDEAPASVRGIVATGYVTCFLERADEPAHRLRRDELRPREVCGGRRAALLESLEHGVLRVRKRLPSVVGACSALQADHDLHELLDDFVGLRAAAGHALTLPCRM